MALKGKPIAIGATDTTIYTCPATTEASVHGLVFANNTGSAVTITLKVYIQSLGTTTTVATGISVGANSTYTWPKPVDVNAGDYIQAVASTGSAVVCLYSVYEGSATAAAVGFTPRGTWSSGSTYATNDVVTVSGTSYLALQASTNQDPATATAYWMTLASKGDTGANGVISSYPGAGISVSTGSAWGTSLTAPSGTIVGTTDTQTLSGKTLTNPTVNNYTEGVVAIGNSSTAQTISLTSGTVQTCTLTGNCTFTMPTATAGKSFVLLLQQNGTGGYTGTFTGVKWPAGTAPTITATASKLDVLTFVSDGTNWYGNIAQNYAIS